MAEEVKENYLKKIISYLPILSILISISSYLKNSIYYYSFNVSFKYYISLSELGILIFHDLLFWVPACLISSTIILFGLKQFRKLPQRTYTTDKPKYLFDRYSDFFGFLLLVIVGFIFALFVNVDKGIGPEFPFWERMLNYSFLLIFLMAGYTTNYIKKDEKYPLTYQIIPILTILFLIFNFFAVISTDIRDTQFGKFKGTIIQTADSSYISNDSSYFIGKTEKYVFIHNNHDTTNWIIPSESIKRILIKEK